MEDDWFGITFGFVDAERARYLCGRRSMPASAIAGSMILILAIVSWRYHVHGAHAQDEI